MTEEGVELDHVQRGGHESRPKQPLQSQTASAPEPSKNTLHMQPETQPSSSTAVDYTFCDYGSDWRLKKLAAVYRTAGDSGRSVEDVALAQYGSLRVFDDAREEKDEIDRRRAFGDGWVSKEKPTGDLYAERVKGEDVGAEMEQGIVVDDQQQDHAVVAGVANQHKDNNTNTNTTILDQTALNKLRARMMKAQIRKAPDAGQLEAEYNAAYAASQPSLALPSANADPSSDNPIVLGVMDSRQLAGPRSETKAITSTKRGRERGQVEENTDMTIDDMVREERRTRGQAGGEGLRMAERIAKDGRYTDTLEYMDENAEKLAKRKIGRAHV